MQVQQKSTFIQSFGGINFIDDLLRKSKFTKSVQSSIGKRNIQATYSYEDLLLQLFYTAAIGGETLDDNLILKAQLADHPSLKIASPDTIEYAFQELRQATMKQYASSGAIHQVNEHEGFNRLMPTICSQFGLLDKQTSYLMDYDGHIVENSKKDSAYTYKRTEGYYPVVCSINKLPVYMQNRNGNTPESYGQLGIIKNALEQCEENGIKVNAFRSDACCYERATIEYLEEKDMTYYIRIEQSRRLVDALDDESEWESVMLNNKKVEVCSIEEQLFGQDKNRRIVAYRYKVQGQLDIQDQSGYRYRAVVTSDTAMTPLQCIENYNKRGCEGEHHFKEFDHDFNWNRLPFDSLEMNTIYMYAMLVAYLLFNAAKTYLSSMLDFVEPTMRLKRFILHFVTLPAKWIKSGRRHILKIFTTKRYCPLYAT